MEGQQHPQQRAKSFPWMRALIALLVSLLVSAAAILLILSTEHVITAYWLVIIPITLAAFGQLIPLYQYLLPISTDTKPDPPLSSPTPVEVKVTLIPPADEPGRNDQTKQPEAPKLLWNIPYPRNPFFTGRESILEELHLRLATHQTTALTQRQAIYYNGFQRKKPELPKRPPGDESKTDSVGKLESIHRLLMLSSCENVSRFVYESERKLIVWQEILSLITNLS